MEEAGPRMLGLVLNSRDASGDIEETLSYTACKAEFSVK